MYIYIERERERERESVSAHTPFRKPYPPWVELLVPCPSRIGTRVRRASRIWVSFCMTVAFKRVPFPRIFVRRMLRRRGLLI